MLHKRKLIEKSTQSIKSTRVVKPEQNLKNPYRLYLSEEIFEVFMC